MKVFIATLSTLLLLSFIGLSEPSHNQKASKETPPLTIKLNVWVVDSKGTKIPNLTPERFQVFEDEVAQTVTAVESKAGPVRFEFCIDTSGSMREVLVNTAKAAKLLVSKMEPGDECNIVRFISSDKIETIQEFTSDTSLLNKAIDLLYIEGGQSAVIDALYVAGQHLEAAAKKSAPGRQAIVIFTDGEDRNSYYKKADLFKLLKETKAPLFLLVPPVTYQTEKAKDKAKNFVNELAVTTGGTAYEISAGKDFVRIGTDFIKAIASISLEMRAPYVITYNSTNPKLDGSLRKIRVDVTNSASDEKLAVFHRTEYRAQRIAVFA
jgi:Ca-activated chloride channel family protein